MRCLIALGGNMGDRRAVLSAALSALGRLPHTRLVQSSRALETPPERSSDGGSFLNAAALLETQLTPERLLRELLAIERRFGRRRIPGQRGPRTLDLDLILLGGQQRRGPRLTLPHPRYRQRGFVLEPAAQVAPSLRDPLRRRTLRELRGELSEAGR